MKILYSALLFGTFQFIAHPSFAHFVESKGFIFRELHESHKNITHDPKENCENNYISENIRNRFFKTTSCNTTQQIRETLITLPPFPEGEPSIIQNIPQKSVQNSKPETYSATEEDNAI